MKISSPWLTLCALGILIGTPVEVMGVFYGNLLLDKAQYISLLKWNIFVTDALTFICAFLFMLIQIMKKPNRRSGK